MDQIDTRTNPQSATADSSLEKGAFQAPISQGGMAGGQGGLELMEAKVSENAAYVAETRYAIRDESGKSTEKFRDILWRVARSLAEGDKNFGKSEEEVKKQAVTFYNLMAQQKFFPNTPCMVNAGKKHQQLSACFVLPIEDSMESILETMSNMALIHKSGGDRVFL